MNPRNQTLLAAALLLVSFVLALPAVAQRPYKQLTYPPLRDLKIPEVERIELPNGLVLYLVEDHTLPKVEGFALIKTGGRFEPADKVGLADIIGQVMRTGGTTARKGEEIDRLLENVGASVETGIGATSATASLFALKEHLPLALEILADLLRNPAFPDDKIELAMVQERTAIARRNDDVSQIANREFTKLLYGKDNPYARHPEYETLQNITRADLVEFHRRYFHPNQTILGLWGDFDRAEVKKLVEQHFGSWPRQPVELPPLPEVKAAAAPGVYFIAKDDVNQTHLRIGHLGGRLDDPDYYALNVLSEILGGGFSSRLVKRVRSELGLAYAVGSAWTAQYDYDGTFFVLCNTRSDATVQAIKEVLAEIQRITAGPVTPKELAVAKESIRNSFVFNFDTTGEIVRRLMTYEYYGYPRDFLEKFRANVEKVTVEDIQRVARQHLHPDKLVILAVGRQQDFDQPLATLGETRTIDIAIPTPKPKAAAVPAATPESLARGRQVLEAAIQARGGLEALKSVRDLAILSRLKQATPMGEQEFVSKRHLLLPDKFRQDVVTPFGEISLILNGEKAWQKSPRGSGPAPPQLVEQLRKELARELTLLLPQALEGGRTVQFAETTTLNDRRADVVVLTDAAGESTWLYVDAENGWILKMAFQGMSREGPVQEERFYSDFRPVGGLILPFKVVALQNGQKTSEQTVSNLEVNINVDPTLFQAPAEEKKPEDKKPE
ncbi:MAG TPA: insulinase family protein [Candidatus Xenobia bacterium]|nr:insulinase family protein [Candidatus Xenobia bacterium]